MKLNYGRDFTILRVVGSCIGAGISYKAYSIYSSYQPGMMNPFSVGDMIALAFSSLIVFYCLTMFWRIELRTDRVISQYGFPLWRKTYTYTGIKSIDFKVDFIEVKNGPDKAYVTVNLSVEGRDRPYPICSLYQVRESLFMKAHFQKKHDDEFLKFKADVNWLRSLYPKVPITLDEKVVSFYESLTSEDFSWR